MIVSDAITLTYRADPLDFKYLPVVIERKMFFGDFTQFMTQCEGTKKKEVNI